MALVFDLLTFSIVATLSICIVAVVLAIDRSTCYIAIEFGVFFFTGIFARAVESMLIFIHLMIATAAATAAAAAAATATAQRHQHHHRERPIDLDINATDGCAHRGWQPRQAAQR